MHLLHPHAHTFIPDSSPLAPALARTTHLGIGAHQDDLEFMAFHGILQCYASPHQWFTGVTCTNGSGSSRTGPYATHTDQEMIAIRIAEQNTAATIGQYSAILQLAHPSSTINNPSDTSLKNDLKTILTATRPTTIYTHNPADKHLTHISVTIATLLAIRELPPTHRPQKIIGCEVWRNLDWLPDHKKILMDVSGRDHLAAALNGVFDSQIAGGKRYDLATLGRRSANATFLDSHSSDTATQLIFGIDLTPLIHSETLDLIPFITDLLDSFKQDVCRSLSSQLPLP